MSHCSRTDDYHTSRQIGHAIHSPLAATPVSAAVVVAAVVAVVVVAAAVAVESLQTRANLRNGDDRVVPHVSSCDFDGCCDEDGVTDAVVAVHVGDAQMCQMFADIVVSAVAVVVDDVGAQTWTPSDDVDDDYADDALSVSEVCAVVATVTHTHQTQQTDRPRRVYASVAVCGVEALVYSACDSVSRWPLDHVTGSKPMGPNSQ